MTAEDAVMFLRNQGGNATFLRDSYLDESVEAAARRFAGSEEWRATRRILPKLPGKALDLGAGRGLASYALAEDGWDVTAIDPNPSMVVGLGAARQLSDDGRRRIRVAEGAGEELTFAKASFDLVYCRQVLHHIADLNECCTEVARVLRVGGMFVAVREHVLCKAEELPLFLAEHLLARLGVDEGAKTRREYTQAMIDAGLGRLRVLGSLETVINYYPMGHEVAAMRIAALLQPYLGYRLSRHLIRHIKRHGMLFPLLATVSSRLDKTPGRLNTFVAVKPSTGAA